MSMLWMDGFDHYGGPATDFMLDGAYADVNNSTLDTTNPRTGVHALKVTSGNDGGLRRVFGADQDTAGVAFAFFIPSLPTNSTSMGIEFRDNANETQCGIGVTSSGQVFFYRGGAENGSANGVILGTSGVAVLARAYQHWECKVHIDPTHGSCEVRLNGVTVLSVTDVNSQGQSEGTTAQVQLGSPGLAIVGFPPYMMVDDLFAWNTNGVVANDFIGDRKVYTSLPDNDTGQADWIPATGSVSYQMLNKVPPVDNTDYLIATNPGEVTHVAFANLPSPVVSVTAVMTATRAFKTDAGDATLVVGLISGSSEDDGAAHALTQSPTYYHDVFETDPETGTLWTPTGFNSTLLSLDRTI